MKSETSIQPLRYLAQSACGAAMDAAALLQECSYELKVRKE